MNTPTPPTVTAPYSNIFAQLSNDEAAGVIQFLHDQSSLNLTAADEAGDWDNSILVVDLYTPNKTDALAYFDGGASPERWAIASMVFGATEEPYVQDWVVGPLPIEANSTQFYPYTPSAKVPEGKIRVRDMDSSYEWTQSFLIELSDVLGDLLQGESAELQSRRQKLTCIRSELHFWWYVDRAVEHEVNQC
jgi:primary-amine oxidase